MVTPPSHVLAVARGDRPADLVLANARIVNIFMGEIERGNVAIAGDVIAGIGDYSAPNTLDLAGAYLAPGLIDAHVHIESSLCVPAEFARAVVPRGVTCVVTDPHEIGNVAGLAGVRWMYRAADNLPLHVVILAPSCVPASPLTRGGSELTIAQIRELKASGEVCGLAEVMNFPAVIAGDGAMREKLAGWGPLDPIDGHCPGVTGKPLNAYAAAGITSDHECVTVEEAREKLARGLYLFIREATNARNLDALLPVITPANSRRICFCTDDRTPGDLLREGSIDHMVGRAIAFGIDPIEALRMATLNTAERFGLTRHGAVAPGRLANLFTFANLQEPRAQLVFAKGQLVARDGVMLASREPAPERAEALGACVVDWDALSLEVPAGGGQLRVIGHRPNQLVTDSLTMAPTVSQGQCVADPARDLLKMAVIARHGNRGTGLGFIRGFGLRQGAIAGTVAHDHHNLVLIGADDRSMRAAGQAVTRLGGGLAVADGDRLLASLPLEVGGLMTARPIEQVATAYDACREAARALGSPLEDPFMAMSFMALEVIPSLKLTADGLVDVEQFRLVPLFT